MRVLLISAKSKVSKGGIVVWTEHYAAGCEQADIQCDIVNSAMIGERALHGTAKRNLKDEIIRMRNMFSQLKMFLHSNSYDIAHLNTNIGMFGIIRDYYLAKKIVKGNIPLVVHFHCDVPYWVTNRVTRYYIKKLLAISNANFVLCENSSRFLKESFGADSIKIANFVEEAMLAQSKSCHSEIKQAVFVGRVSKAKGAKEIFELAGSFPQIQFLLIGEVSTEIAELKMPDNLNLLGMLPHAEVLDYMDHSDIFLFPSHTEGFSLALAEAMARGLPVIATDVGANRDMIENKGGIIIPVGDVSAMRTALLGIEDAKVRHEMSKWNIEKVQNEYVTPMVIDCMKRHYLDVIEANAK